jgi:MFS transporter, DHA1 family, staphyloferrin A biosynthesis exporter
MSVDQDPAASTAAAAPALKQGMFEALRIRDFRYLWFANIAATFGMQMQMVARGWLIYDMTSSPLALTWVMLSFMMPSFVFSLLGGVLADRVKKKSVMMVAQSLNAAATVALAVIVFTGNVTFWHFIYFGLFNGTVMAMSMPARSSVIPEIVGRDSLVNAMALQGATFNLSRIVGPALAGMLIAGFAATGFTTTQGTGAVFFVIAALYLSAVFATSKLHYSGSPVHRAGATVAGDVAEGFRYMRNDRIILGLLILGFVPMTFGFAISFLLPAFNQDVIGGGPQSLGLLMTSMGAGALLGSLILARLGDVNHKGRILFFTAYLWAVLTAGFALSNTLWLAMALGAATSIFSAMYGSLNMSILQLAVSSEIRGRVMSINMMAMGLMPIGVIPVSAAAEFIGIHQGLLLSAVLLAVSVLVLGFLFPEVRKIDKGYDEQAALSPIELAGPRR